MPDSLMPDSSPCSSRALDCNISGPAGSLEATLQTPATASAADPVAVVAHPHPLHGGTMDNTVVLQTAGVLVASGIATLRFNFRGVGQSDGTHDGGLGEVHDLEAALGWLVQRFPNRPLWLAGYSFGAATILRLEATTTAQALLLLAPPLSVYDFSKAPMLISSADASQVGPRVAMVYGELDEFTALPHRIQWQAWEPVVALQIPGVGHDLGGSSSAVQSQGLHSALRQAVNALLD